MAAIHRGVMAGPMSPGRGRTFSQQLAFTKKTRQETSGSLGNKPEDSISCNPTRYWAHLAQRLTFSVPVHSCNYRDPLTLALRPRLVQASASLHLISCGKINTRLGPSLASPEVARSRGLWLPAVSVIVCNVSRVLPFPGFRHLFMYSGPLLTEGI